MTATRNYELIHQIDIQSREINDHTGAMVKIIDEHTSRELADQLEYSLREVYIEALSMSVWPLRYLRNRSSLSDQEQILLSESEVAVIGAGGLGGHVILLLARLGIGRLVIIDQDIFDETNLNRQVMCTTDNIGEPKVSESAKSIHLINPAVELVSRYMKLKPDSEDIGSSNVLVDALDNDSDRLILGDLAAELGKPLVHGAVAGFEGHIMTIMPGDKGLSLLYSNEEHSAPQERAESILGTPVISPCTIGSFMTMEVVKLLLNKKSTFRNMMVHIDLMNGSLSNFKF